jgi:hypothetical protein
LGARKLVRVAAGCICSQEVAEALAVAADYRGEAAGRGLALVPVPRDLLPP